MQNFSSDPCTSIAILQRCIYDYPHIEIGREEFPAVDDRGSAPSGLPKGLWHWSFLQNSCYMTYIEI